MRSTLLSNTTQKMEQGQKKEKLIRRLKNKYRLVIMNDNFEERWSFLLSPLNIVSAVGITLLVLITGTYLIIAYTPLRETIPDFPSDDIRTNAEYAAFRADSLEAELKQTINYLETLKVILAGDVPSDSVQRPGEDSQQYSSLDFAASKEDSLLREEMETGEQYNITFNAANKTNKRLSGVFFFTPLRGTITASFNPKNNHPGVDIVAPKNESIKATLDGVVIFASWTSDAGYVMHIQHSNNLVSIYKHNSVLLKQVGDRVKAGDSVAIIGDTGELTDGPHLHFELWHNGRALNPEDLIVFK